MSRRAERRFNKENVVKARAKNYYTWLKRDNESWAKFYDNVKKGIHNQFVKHTGVVCSCWMCSKANKFSKKDRLANKKVEN